MIEKERLEELIKKEATIFRRRIMNINELIKEVASYSKTEQHETLINMLDHYKKNSLKDLNAVEVSEYLSVLKNIYKDREM